MPRNGKRVSPYLSQKAIACVEKRVSSGRVLSPTLAEIILRYEEVCKRSIPVLSAELWRELADRLRGWTPDIEHLREGILRRLGAEPHTASWNWAPAALAVGQYLSYHEILAVVDVIENFWAAHERGEPILLPGGP